MSHGYRFLKTKTGSVLKAPLPMCLWRHRQAGTSEPQSGEALYLQPCRPHPSRPRPAFRGRGSGKWSAQRVGWTRPCTGILGRQSLAVKRHTDQVLGMPVKRATTAFVSKRLHFAQAFSVFLSTTHPNNRLLIFRATSMPPQYKGLFVLHHFAN